MYCKLLYVITIFVFSVLHMLLPVVIKSIINRNIIRLIKENGTENEMKMELVKKYFYQFLKFKK